MQARVSTAVSRDRCVLISENNVLRPGGRAADQRA